jgi:hypothetical protein
VKYSFLSWLSIWLFVAVIALQFIIPFIYPIAGHDAPAHLNWIGQFVELFNKDNLYPRWMPDSFFGFGSPAFYFYPPLFYWLAGCISIIYPTGPIYIYHVLGFIITAVSIGSCYVFLKSTFADKEGAWVGALLYGIAPYRFLDLYIRNAIGEHLAFVFLPILFLSIEKAIRIKKRDRNTIAVSILLSAFGWAGLLLTNIPTTIVVAYSLPLYAIGRVWHTKGYIKLLFPVLGAVIGVMIAGVYLLPALSFSADIQLNHLLDLTGFQRDTGYSLIDVMGGKSSVFFIGLVATLLSGSWFLFYILRYKRKEEKNYGLIAILLFSILFQIPFIFSPLWRIMPFSNLVQFTWRLNIIIVLAAAIFINHYYHRKNSQIIHFIGLYSILTIIVMAGFGFKMEWDNKIILAPLEPSEYITSQGNYHAIQNDNRFERYEHTLVISSETDQFLSYKVHSFVRNELKFTIVNNSPQPSIIIFHLMYFPTWKLYDSKNVPIAIFADSIGRINAQLYSGDYKLAMEESPSEKNGKIISLTGLIIFAFIGMITIFWRSPKAS